MDNPNEKVSEKENNSQCQKPKTSLPRILVVILAVILIIYILIPKMNVDHFPPKKVACRSNLRVLGDAIYLYAIENDYKYPIAEKWCDLIMQYLGGTMKQFICRGSDAVVGESSYAFNKNLAGKKISEVPGNVVVLFETNFGRTPVGRDGTIGDRDCNKALRISDPNREVYKLRWNQAGGPELLTVENHKGCNVLFNDIHVEFVKTEKLKDLKWKPEENK